MMNTSNIQDTQLQSVVLGRQCVGFINIDVSLSPAVVASLFSPVLLSLIQSRVFGSAFNVLVVARVHRRVAR